ncbi:SPW repeat domain-containing protein [Natronococcus wangiae]|uniref:SPW repeat domain-containing protein n=1 Tax=Natronococcus wangiae TaxID=3068275 RepID=UPI00273D8FEF|nr:hypothetical protein [Natronococcus sp. AD5]
MLPRTVSAATAVLGIWMIAAQVVLGASATFQWTVAVTGALIGTLSGCAHRLERGDRSVVRPAAAATTLFGIWLLIAPFLFRVDGIQRWNAVIVGVLVTSLAGYNVYITARLRDEGPPVGSGTKNP